jgi:hypothetical protein
MTFAHLYSSALHQQLGTDDSTLLFTDARRKTAINNGALTFVDLTECVVRQSTVTCSNGVAEYNLLASTNIPGGDYLRLSKQGPEFHHTNPSSQVTYVAGPDDFPRRDIPWLNQYEPGWRNSTGSTPHAYYERADGGSKFFGLVPPPEIQTSATAQIVVPYVAKPAVMSSDTDVPFTFGSTTRHDLEPYHQALVHYAAHELELLRRDVPASQQQMGQFMGYVERYTRAVQPKGGQQVRLGRNYFSEARQGRGQEVEQPVPYPWIR